MKAPLGPRPLWLPIFVQFKITRPLLLHLILQHCTQRPGFSASMEMPLIHYVLPVLMVGTLGHQKFLGLPLIVKVVV